MSNSLAPRKIYTQVEVKECDDGSGDVYFEIPPEILKKLGWQEGDDVKFDVQKNGSISIKKVKLESVAIEIDDDELFKVMTAAHERGQSFNDFCSDAIDEQIKKWEFESESG